MSEKDGGLRGQEVLQRQISLGSLGVGGPGNELIEFCVWQLSRLEDYPFLDRACYLFMVKLDSRRKSSLISNNSARQDDVIQPEQLLS